MTEERQTTNHGQIATKSLEQLKQTTETRALTLLDNGTNHAGLQIFTPTWKLSTLHVFLGTRKQKKKHTRGGGGVGGGAGAQSSPQRLPKPPRCSSQFTTPKAHNQTSTFLLYKPEGRA